MTISKTLDNVRLSEYSTTRSIIYIFNLTPTIGARVRVRISQAKRSDRAEVSIPVLVPQVRHQLLSSVEVPVH